MDTVCLGVEGGEEGGELVILANGFDIV